MEKMNPTYIVDMGMLKSEVCDIKTMDIEHMHKLKESLRMFGQLRPILVDPDFKILEGRKIAAAAKELGMKLIECKVISHELSFIARLCLDSEYSVFNFVKVSQQLSGQIDLSQKDKHKHILPFRNGDIDDFIESLDFDFEQYNAQKNTNQISLF